MQPKQKKILVVDDDPNFRHLLTEIFSANRYEVVAVKSSQDALAVLDSRVGLAIVDYRLPDTDGMTLISQMRERGNNLPVVFISGAFCDAKTFNWLRNILKVSLVLQKPIQPNLFIQQLEGLLPARMAEEKKPEEMHPIRASINEEEYEHLLLAASGIDVKPKFAYQSGIDATTSGEEKDQDIFAHIEQMRRKMNVEAKIRQAQLELRKTIPPQWRELCGHLSNLQQNAEDTGSRKAAIDVSHKLRGTAGSLGLTKVSSCAGKIEDFLVMLDPSEATEHEILWGEIFRALADGETGLSFTETTESIDVPSPEEGPDTEGNEDEVPANLLRTLILGNARVFKEYLIAPAPNNEYTFASSPTDAVMKASSNRFDTALIDLSTVAKSSLSHVVKALRATPSNLYLPIGVAVTAEDRIDAIDAAYIGISEVLGHPIDQLTIDRCIRRLSRKRHLHQPRILTVDDDNVLTRFIQTVLRSEGMNVTQLNQPINILQALEECEPELVLLDVVMPGLSGYDVCRLIKSRDQFKDVPIIFLTSKSDAQGRAAAFQAGGDDFLSKPILSEELVMRVKTQFERANPRRQALILDETTGLVKREVFWNRFQLMIESAKKNQGNAALGLISINNYEDLGRHGLFVEMAVAAALGKMVAVRFKAEALRGRWSESVFAIAIAEEERHCFEEALRLFAKEANQIPFMGDMGRFEITVSTSTSVYPDDAKLPRALLDAALLQLNARDRATGGLFTS